MSRNVVTTYTVTDDITKKSWTSDEEDSYLVGRYMVTITEVDENDKPVKGEVPLTYINDMHKTTHAALCDFLSPQSTLGTFLIFILNLNFGSKIADALYRFTKVGLGETPEEKSNNVIKAFGGVLPGQKNKQASNGTGNEYTKHIREYAVARNWNGANGNPIAAKGKMSANVVIKFVKETGITLAEFNSGKRAKIVPLVTETPVAG